MSTDELTGRELRAAAFAAIRKELGPDALVRFISQNLTQSGRDYTAERRNLPQPSVEEIIADYERLRAGQGGSLAPPGARITGGRSG